MLPTLMALLKDQRSYIDPTTPPERDFLGQVDALKTLLAATQEIKPPSCMALYGSWGAGKTALMWSAYEQLRRDKSSRAVWFDPWPYERHHDVLAMLILTILAELGLEKTHSAKLKDLVVRLLKPVFTIVGRIGPSLVAAAAGDPTAAATLNFTRIDPANLADQLATEGSIQDDVQEIRTRFAELMDEALKDRGPLARVVVFLDDLDRCLPDRAVWLLEATKLLLADGQGNARAVFVFGLDRQIVGEAIRNRYPESTLYSGENYLEKIFDLSLEAPPVRPNDEKVLAFIEHVGGKPALDTIDSGFGGGKDDLVKVMTDPVFANPRVIKRVMNRLFLLTRNRTLADTTISKTRLFAWVAGTERFRTFRHFFVQASDEELTALDEAVPATSGKTSDSADPPARVRALVDTPGFIGFYRNKGLLGIEKRNTAGAHIKEQRETSTGDEIRTLRDLDDYLRSMGL